MRRKGCPWRCSLGSIQGLQRPFEATESSLGRGQLVLRTPAIQPHRYALIGDAFARFQLGQTGANVLVLPAIGRKLHGDDLRSHVGYRQLTIMSQGRQLRLNRRNQVGQQSMSAA